METYNYDAAAVPEGDADTTPAAAPETDAAAAGTSDTAQSGFNSQPPVILTYPDSSSDDLQVSPGFGPYGDVMPSLPSNNHGSPNTGGCINCGGSNWKPSPNGALWTWGILSPFFSTSSEIAHLRFYNAGDDVHVARIIHVIQIGYDQTSVQVDIDRFADGGGIVETQVRDLR